MFNCPLYDNAMQVEKLLELDKQGLIPGPLESEQEFEKRAEYCLNLKKNLQEQLEDKLPFPSIELMNPPIEKALAQTQAQYGIMPRWVPVFFSNAQLPPWHGGCAWIFQINDKSPVSGFIQLRKHFYQSERYLTLYQRDEILAHEFAHIGRMCFEEPKFEEFLAYQSSPSAWRKRLGPLVQSSWESLLFVILLLLIFIIDGFMLWFGDFLTYYKLMGLKLIPLLLLGAGVLRLVIRNQQLVKCRETLSKITPDPLTVNAITYRLTDKEIIALGRMDLNMAMSEIQKWIRGGTLRWQLISKGYLYEYFGEVD